MSYIRENRDELIERLKIKNFQEVKLIDELIKADDERKSLQQKQDQLQADLNTRSKEIGSLYKAGRQEEANVAKEATVGLKEEIRLLQQAQAEAIGKLKDLLVLIPNIPHESVPPGKGEKDNERQQTPNW